MITFAIALFCFIINLPMGAYRVRVPRFSARWFLAVHATVPVIIALRILSGTPLLFIPAFIITAVLGQFAGGKISGHINTTGI